MSERDEVWQTLQETLPQHAIEWRIQQSGTTNDGRTWARVVPYPDARWLEDRLDQAVGPENWTRDYLKGPAGGVLCSLAIRVDGEWISKEDGAENTDIESVKGGLTDAFKRACVAWNVGGIRSLYRVDECWANIHDGGTYNSKIAGKRRDWDPPEIELSDSGVTVSHKRNGSTPDVQETDDETLDRIWELQKKLSGLDQEKADDVEEWLINRSEAVERDPKVARKAVERLETLVRERRTDAEQANTEEVEG